MVASADNDQSQDCTPAKNVLAMLEDCGGNNPATIDVGSIKMLRWPMLYQLDPVEVDYGDETFRADGVWYAAVDPTIFDGTPDTAVNDDGTNVITEVSSDDSSYAVLNVYKDKHNDDHEDCIESGWNDNGIPSGSTIDSVTYYFKHYESDTKPDLTIQWWDGSGWIQVYNPPETTSEQTHRCDLTSYINTVAEANNVNLRYRWYYSGGGHKSDSMGGGGGGGGGGSSWSYDTYLNYEHLKIVYTPSGGDTNTAPSISNVRSSAPTTSQVYITWNTDQSDSDNRVKYSLKRGLSGYIWSVRDYNTDSVNIPLTGLSPSTTYYYSAYSYNGTDGSLYSSSDIYSFTTAESGDGETTYDFSSGAGADKWAYRYQAGSEPPGTNDVPGIEFESSEYNLIKTNNNDFQSDTADTYYYAAHRFKFDIQESIETIASIYVFWNGAGYHDSNTDGATLWIWDYNGDVYEQLDTTTSSSEVDLTGDITANFGNYINPDGYLTILVEQNDKTWRKKCGGMMGGGGGHDWYHSHIETDYVKVGITHTTANHPPSVETPKTYDSSLIERYTFEMGETVTIRTDVTDPEGSGDIGAVTITITNPDSFAMVNNAAMNAIYDIASGYVYEYDYTIPDKSASKGMWLVHVYASDKSGARAGASTFFDVISLGVSLNADGPYNPGDVVYIHGRVLYADGTPVDGATVKLKSTDPDNKIINYATVTTNSAGYYSIEYVLSDDAAAGMYTVEADVTRGNLQQIKTTTYSVKKVAKPSNIRIVTDRDVYLITPQIWVDNGATCYSPRTVTIGVLIMDADGMCVSGKDLTVTVGYPDGSAQTVAMTEDQDGFWNGDFTVYHDDPTNTYTITATTTDGEPYSGTSTFDVDRFGCDSDNCHNYERHKHGYKGAHDASAQEAHRAHSPIRSRGKSRCRVCHTGQDLDCAECHTDLFRGTHANVPESTLTKRCNHCHDGYDDYDDTGIAEPVPECNTPSCHNGDHEDKPALLHQGTHADDKVDCGYCHNNMHSIFEPSCEMCHQTKDDHSEKYEVGCSICHDNKPMVYTGVKLYSSTEKKYSTTYYTNVDIHSNDLIPECTVCHGSPQYTDHLGAASCIQCHENVPLDYTGVVLPENKTYYTNATIHTTNRTLILPNQTLTYNDNCEVCHYQIYGFMTPEEHSNDTDCSACHWGLEMEYQDVDQNKPIEHTTNMDRVSCFECHTDRAMIEKSGKMRYWVNATMYGASVHGNNPGDDCVMCHTDYHPPPEYKWKWCDCCHVVQSDPTIDVDRHNVTASPTTLDVTDCTQCHNATSYANSINRYGGASADHNCRWCHTYPDQEYE